MVPCRELCDRAPDAGRLQVHGVPRVLTSGEDPKRAFEGLQAAWRAAACDSHHSSTSMLRMERNSAHSNIKGGSQRDEIYGSAVGVEFQESNREQVAKDRDSLLRVASFLQVVPNAPRSQLRATKMHCSSRRATASMSICVRSTCQARQDRETFLYFRIKRTHCDAGSTEGDAGRLNFALIRILLMNSMYLSHRHIL